jgi:hypothetical protein
MRATFLAVGTLVLGLGTWGAWSVADDAEEEEPKYTIKEVMKTAHKEKLLQKVANGEGTEEDAKLLLELYTALSQNEPPKGDPEHWKQMTGAIVEGAQAVVDGTDGAGKKLLETVNCGECHGEHKPS